LVWAEDALMLYNRLALCVGGSRAVAAADPGRIRRAAAPQDVAAASEAAAG